MALAAVSASLNAELDLLSTHFQNFAAGKAQLASPANFSLLDECLLEGLLSRVWQAWNEFCRRCVIESCMGTTNGAGVVVPALPDALSEAHVSGAAILAKKQTHPPYWNAPNSVLRAEPTWGDVDVLVKILPRLRPANINQLVAAFSMGHPATKALQLIRNGAAHNHAQNMAEIMTLRSSYRVFPIGHPTHSMFWIEPHSADFLVMNAIDRLKDAGATAIL